MRLPEEFRTRTKKYASAIIGLYVRLPRRRKEVEVLGHQLLRSGTSVAAHTREASRARSDAEFCSKIDGALQEADESQLWIEVLCEDCGIERHRRRTAASEQMSSSLFWSQWPTKPGRP
jgi:four helix bundle protein